MSSQHPSSRHGVGRQPRSTPHTTPTKRYFITSEGDGTIIRAVPTAPRMANGSGDSRAAEAVAETVAADRRHRVSMRRFLRTPFLRSGR